jgi:hypothetical protein
MIPAAKMAEKIATEKTYILAGDVPMTSEQAVKKVLVHFGPFWSILCQLSNFGAFGV